MTLPGGCTCIKRTAFLRPNLPGRFSIGASFALCVNTSAAPATNQEEEACQGQAKSEDPDATAARAELSSGLKVFRSLKVWSLDSAGGIRLELLRLLQLSAAGGSGPWGFT